jgi:hypothetical protein
VFGDTSFLDLEVTHRGMHRFVPRHKDEIAIEIGDPIHVFRLDDDLWCEGKSRNIPVFPNRSLISRCIIIMVKEILWIGGKYKLLDDGQKNTN